MRLLRIPKQFVLSIYPTLPHWLCNKCSIGIIRLAQAKSIISNTNKVLHSRRRVSGAWLWLVICLFVELNLTSGANGTSSVSRRKLLVCHRLCGEVVVVALSVYVAY